MVVDEAVGNGSRSPLCAFIGKILEWITATYDVNAVATAKEEFFWKTGKVFPDDEVFCNRMDYFSNYFLFQRKLEATPPITPFQAYLQCTQTSTSENIITGYKHSLYIVAKTSTDHLMLTDLFSGEKIHATFSESGMKHAFNKKDIFQGFLFTCDHKHLLSRGFIFHPGVTSGILKKLIKNARKSGDFEEKSLLFHLARKQLKHFRHPNIPAKQLYASHQV